MAFAEPILHIDMDAFFVECERLRNPDPTGQTGSGGAAGAIVGYRRGVLRSSQIWCVLGDADGARQTPVPPSHRGPRHPRPLWRNLCRGLCDRRRGGPTRRAPQHRRSLPDISGLTLLHSDARSVADHLRRRIRDEVGIPSSCGIATNKFLAKLASGRAKPDGVYVIDAEHQLEILHSFDVRAMWGVGEATYAGLERLGVRTIGDLASVGEKALQRAFGSQLVDRFFACRWVMTIGWSNRTAKRSRSRTSRPTKSIFGPMRRCAPRWCVMPIISPRGFVEPASRRRPSPEGSLR